DGFGFSNDARQPLRSAGPGQHSQRNFRQSHFARAVTSDTDVGSHRDFKSSADTMTVDCCDDQLRRLLQTRKRFIRVQTEIIVELRRYISEYLNICAGAEKFLCDAGD